MVKGKVPDIRPMQLKFLRAMTSQDEYALFMEQWNRLWKAHGDEWVAEYDFDDVYKMVLEDVIMARWMLIRAKDPKQFSASEHKQAHERYQIARDNLDARKASRAGGTGSRDTKTSTTNFNLALMMQQPAGEIIEQRKVVLQKSESMVNGFLERTHNQSVDVDKLLEITPKENDDGSTNT